MSTDATDAMDDMNEAIAIFDGYQFLKGDPTHKCNFCFAGDEPCTPAVDRFVKNGRTLFHYQLKYHTSWDWLMPVIKRIREQHTDLLLTLKNGVGEYIKAAGAMNSGLISCDIDKAHAGVNNFIQWYHQNKNQ